MLRIATIQVENLRCYQSTSLELEGLTVLVGENNEGKSSILKMLERFLAIPPAFWGESRVLSEQESEFWYPANNARHKARRLTVFVEFVDGRAARKFGVKKGKKLELRFAVSRSGACRLNIGAPRRNETHDPKAEALLIRLQTVVSLHLLPPVRDARASSFAEKVTGQVRQTLQRKMQHNKQAGAPKEYRLAKDAIGKIQEIVGLQAGELARSKDSPLAAMLKSSEVRVELFPEHIYNLIAQSLFVYLSTGEHDSLKVLPGEVGNGLQSLIDIGMTLEELLKASEKGRTTIVIIEEPEAFLHPSAQRQFMQYLRRALVERVQAAILTTHSPIIVDEAKYEEIVLVRQQKHFAPNAVPDDRAAINTSLMTAANAEVFFARTVVLLEGEGDKAFFNTLFRRIKAKASVCPELTGLVFQTTGGCRFYAPWLKLVRSYKRLGEDPFSCVWVMDGDAAHSSDGSRAVLHAAKECGFNLTAAETDAVVAFGDLPWSEADRSVNCVNAANEVLAPHGGHLFSCDIEWALFNESSAGAIKSIKRALKRTRVDDGGSEVELARRLGSKIRDGKTSSGAKKYPFVRSAIAEEIGLGDLPPEILAAVRRIVAVCFKDAGRADEIIQACGITGPFTL